MKMRYCLMPFMLIRLIIHFAVDLYVRRFENPEVEMLYIIYYYADWPVSHFLGSWMDDYPGHGWSALLTGLLVWAGWGYLVFELLSLDDTQDE